MATNVDVRGLSGRALSRQLVHTMRKTVNFNDAGIATGVKMSADALPQGAFITKVMVEVVTAFNAATTNTLTVGTNSASFNNIVSSADLTGNGSSSLSVQVSEVTRGYGRSLANAGDTNVTVMYVQTGTAATTGQAVVVIEYEANYAG